MINPFLTLTYQKVRRGHYQSLDREIDLHLDELGSGLGSDEANQLGRGEVLRVEPSPCRRIVRVVLLKCLQHRCWIAINHVEHYQRCAAERAVATLPFKQRGD